MSDFCDPHGLSLPGIFQARILGWVAISFSRGSSWPRDQTCVSCIARRSLYHWDTREAQINQFTCIQCEDCNIQFWKWKSDPMDYTVHRILQARILEWVAFPFSRYLPNPGLPHCRWILYPQLSHKGSPRILEWVAYPFSRWSSRPRNWTRVSCIAGRFFTNWTIREAQFCFEAEFNLSWRKVSVQSQINVTLIFMLSKIKEEC